MIWWQIVGFVIMGLCFIVGSGSLFILWIGPKPRKKVDPLYLEAMRELDDEFPGGEI